MDTSNEKTTLYEKKAQLRRECRKIRSQIEDKQKKDENVCRHLVSMRQFLSCDVLLAYFPVGTELDVGLAIEKARRLGKRVAFPVCTSERDMIFRFCDTVPDAGMYGIPEPSDECETCIPSERTFCIVPALAVDKEHNRMGYGKGYYDNFLRSFPGTCAVVTYDELVFDSIPHDENDFKISTIITQGGSLS
jgi:5-formyltetrahydrofolate cyclo-ligase